jgi:hypothetical protein
VVSFDGGDCLDNLVRDLRDDAAWRFLPSILIFIAHSWEQVLFRFRFLGLTVNLDPQTTQVFWSGYVCPSF